MTTENPSNQPHRIVFELEMQSITIVLGGGWQAFGRAVEKVISRALQERGVYGMGNMVAWENRAIGEFRVTNEVSGLMTIKEELESLDLLGSARISLLDPEDNVFRVWHPVGGIETIALTNQSLRAWNAKIEAAIALKKTRPQ